MTRLLLLIVPLVLLPAAFALSRMLEPDPPPTPAPTHADREQHHPPPRASVEDEERQSKPKVQRASKLKPHEPAPARDSAPPFEVAAASRTAGAAARAYALESNNWTWRTYARQSRRLASLTEGALHARHIPGRRQRGELAELRRDRAGSHGRLISVEVAMTTDTTARASLAVRQRAYGYSLGALSKPYTARYDAQLTLIADGWKLTDWQPRL